MVVSFAFVAPVSLISTPEQTPTRQWANKAPKKFRQFSADKAVAV